MHPLRRAIPEHVDVADGSLTARSGNRIMRATICVEVSRADASAAVAAWFTRWRDRLAFASENEGCGCCVDMWNVDGPAEAIAEIPPSVRAASEWSGIP